MKRFKILWILAIAAALSIPSQAGVIRFAAKTTYKAAKPVAKLTAKTVKFAAKVLF